MKLFKNCPGERHKRKECDGCPLLKRCLVKKVKRRIRKNFFKILWMLIILISIVIIWIVKPGNKNQDKNTKNKEYGVSSITNNVTVTNINVKVKEVKTTVKPKSKKSIKKIAKTKKTKKAKSKDKITSSKTLEIYSSLNDSDKKLMEKVVYAESRGEPFKGQVAVAAVILNRYTYCNQKQSIRKIVTQPGQFADISSITQKMLDAYPDCKKAVEEALKGNDPTRTKFSKGARYFYEPDLVSDYQKSIRQNIEILQIGSHYFHNDFSK